MKYYVIGMAFLAILFSIDTVFAEPAITKIPLVTNTTVLFWATGSQIDWFSGIALALTGLIGALVTIFFLIGGVVPGTAGQVDIDYDSEQVKEYKEKLKKLWDKESLDDAELRRASELKTIVNDFDSRLDKERRRQFSLAATLYAVIGAFFAAFLAHDVLQALIIGAGWTGYLGALGLKSDAAERGARKNDKIDDLLNKLKEKEKVIGEMKKSEVTSDVTEKSEQYTYKPEDIWAKEVKDAERVKKL
jgi:hypothetical protein